MTLKNFLKNIICVGVVYASLKVCNFEKKGPLLILVSIVLLVSDMICKTENMKNMFKKGCHKEIDLSFDFKDPETKKKIDNLIKESTETNLELIKVSESEAESETKAESESESEAESESESEAESEAESETKAENVPLDINKKTDYSDVYMNMLVKILKKRRILDKNDIKKINAKLKSKLLTVPDIINSLEKLMKSKKVIDEHITPKEIDDGEKSNTMKYSKRSKNHYKPIDNGEKSNTMKYSERSKNYYKPIGEGVDKWSNDYTILNTEKWQIPLTRPPVCISNNKCPVCPSITDGYPTALKEWDNSRKVTNMKINKKWANDQMDTSDILISED